MVQYGFCEFKKLCGCNLKDSKKYIADRKPAVFDMTTVAFVTRPDFIINNSSIWDGRLEGYYSKRKIIDIDDAFDFSIAEFLMNERISQKIMENKVVLITGAAGKLGTSLSKSILENNGKIVMVDTRYKLQFSKHSHPIGCCTLL